MPTFVPSDSVSAPADSADAKIQALLIGIDHHPHAPGLDLRGAVADVGAFANYLAGRGVRGDAVRRLISAGPEDSPNDLESVSLPTYRNMIHEIRLLGRRAAAHGHHALIYFSGHGSRVPSMLAPSKSKDECLVPCDVGRPGARWLRDVELTFLLDEMLASGLEVTCIVDACHSAGVVRRGEAPRPRRVLAGREVGAPEAGSDVADLEVLRSRWQAIHGQRTERVKRSGMLDISWLSESVLRDGGLTLLAACRQQEVAREYPIDGIYRGGMTYFLVKILEASTDPSSEESAAHWLQVHGRLTESLKQLAKSHSVGPQFPILEGKHSDYLFPSSGIPKNRILIKSVEGDRVLLGAGRAWGIGPGDLLSTAPYADESQKGRLVVREAAAQEAWALWLNPETSPALVVGQGVQWEHLGAPSAEVPRAEVAVDVIPSALSETGAPKRRVLRNGQRLAPPTAPNEQVVRWIQAELTHLEMPSPNWSIQVQGGRCQVQPPGDLGLADLPSIPVRMEADIHRVVGQLHHLSLWQRFWQLGSPTAEHGSLTVQVAPQLVSTSPEAPLEPGTPLPSPVQCVRDRLYLLGLGSTGYQTLHFVMLSLMDDGSMSWLYPPAGSGEELEPGHRLWLRWTPQRAGRQRLKVIATVFPMAVSPWSLPPVAQAREVRRGAWGDSAASSAAMAPASPWPLKEKDRFYFTDAHRYWTSAFLDVHVLED